MTTTNLCQYTPDDLNAFAEIVNLPCKLDDDFKNSQLNKVCTFVSFPNNQIDLSKGCQCKSMFCCGYKNLDLAFSL